ncbi:thermonuclease family protein [Candidatus Gottesmanbacteria bacterium]|nr:thermonuclease family protein [Candidatus Gottesmanbacteria bacterium]MBI5452731.1 thermonuclease family protein [Candidatus Gottesmanbacteria bacterium]
MRLLFLFILLIAVTSLLLNAKLISDRITSKRAVFQVSEVIDGDTFKIMSNNEERRVRLMGVDIPETGKCLSSEAKDKLTQLVLGKDVVLEDQFSDPYGRIMANVYAGNIFVNKEMLSSGLGRMDYYENPHKEELKAAYADAKFKKLGIFSGICISKTPPVSNKGIPCAIKGNIDDNTQKKIYFLPGCRNYSQVTIDLSTADQWFCSENEAVTAGFTKSTTCN